jgi:hypothetical protein
VDTGASGSPVLTRDRQQIIGVLNFTNQPAASEREEEDQEVLEELAPGFPPLTPDSNFGSPVPWLNDCFISGVFSTQPEHCSLFPRFSVEFKNTPERYAKVRLDSEGKHVYPGWNLRFSVDKPRYRYKKADRPLDCEDPAGYSGTRAAQEATITEPIDGPIGINWLCIVGVDAAEEQPSAGLMRNALTLAVELQPAGPTAAPLMSIEQKPSGTYAVRWQYDAGLIDHYTVKMGPPDATDCSDPQGFTRRPGDSLLVTARSLPRKICTCAHDVNGQPSAVREDLLVESVAQ